MLITLNIDEKGKIWIKEQSTGVIDSYCEYIIVSVFPCNGVPKIILKERYD